MKNLNGAVLSEDRRYRYRLWRHVPGGVAGRAVFVMLNPSTANATHDDPTIRRCTGFAARYGFTRYDVVNLYSFRSDDPERLLSSDVTPVNAEQWLHIVAAISEADVVILAWGAHRSAARPNSEVDGVLGWIALAGKTPLCLGVNKDGSPKHPLYLAKNTELIPYDV